MKCLLCIALVLNVVLSFGCSSGDSGAYTGPLGNVKGTVTYLNKPLPEGASVSFSGEGEKGFLATGQTDSSGAFVLKWNGQKGIPVGSYKVAIVQPPLFTETDPDKLMQMSQKGQLPKPVAQVPSKYNSPGTSGLLMQISEGENDFKIELD